MMFTRSHRGVVAPLAALARIRNDGMAMVLVEQNLQRALSLADGVVVLTHGWVVLEGTPEEIARKARLVALYIGEPTG